MELQVVELVKLIMALYHLTLLKTRILRMGEVKGRSSRLACAACKHHRRKCSRRCITAPYFPEERRGQYHAVQRRFGLSNIRRLITEAPLELRDLTVRTMIFEAEARSCDPVKGCLPIIQDLEAKIAAVWRELEATRQLVRIHSQLHKRQQEIDEMKQQLLVIREQQQQACPQLDMYQQQQMQLASEISTSMIEKLLVDFGTMEENDEVISSDRTAPNSSETGPSDEASFRTTAAIHDSPRDLSDC